MFRNRSVSLALAGLFLWVTACSSYSQIELGEVTDHGKVRVTLTDGERETIHDPSVETDTIRGHVKSRYEREYSDPIVVIPLDQVDAVEVGSFNPFQTFALLFGIAAGAVAIAFAAWGICCNWEY